MTMADEPRPVEEMSFREVMRELDDIVSSLESNQLELEESLRRYERGVELLRVGRSRLDGAQQKVTSLLGTLEEEPTDDTDTTLS